MVEYGTLKHAPIFVSNIYYDNILLKHLFHTIVRMFIIETVSDVNISVKEYEMVCLTFFRSSERATLVVAIPYLQHVVY